jgi:hypothetical protein
MTAPVRQEWLEYLPNGAHYSEAGFFTRVGPPPTRVGAPPSAVGELAPEALMGPAPGASMGMLNQSLGL